MTDSVRDEFVHPQCQTPAPFGFQRQCVGRTQELNVHAAQLATRYRGAKLAKMLACIYQRASSRHGQDVVDLGVPMKQVDHFNQLFLGFDVVSPDRLEGNKVDNGSELMVDPVVQLVQEGSSLQQALRVGMGHSGLL